MKLSDLTTALITASEKAANIARVIRSERTLFDLLVEEKTGDSKNKRFVEDFKTLGDVLVQETVRHDVAKRFGGLADQIYGEESNTFTNTLGETVEVRVCQTQPDTCRLLDRVLDGNTEAADLLAKAVHQDIAMATPSELEAVEADIDMSSVGIWIDPIDSTAQYISGKDGGSGKGGVYCEGLQCVVVLIGAYSMTSGLPIVGVCNQPFSVHDTSANQWRGRCVWGVSCDSVQCHHIPALPEPSSSWGVSPGAGENHPRPQDTSPRLAVVISSSEKQPVQSQLTDGGFNVCHAAGAGYKTLCVIDGLVSSYLLTSGSTFKWDTCAPHAILRSLGGGIVDLGALTRETSEAQVQGNKDLCALLENCQLRYGQPDDGIRPRGEKWSNSRGIIAYVDKNVVDKLLKCFI